MEFGEQVINNPLTSGFLKNAFLYPNSNAIFINENYYTYSQLFAITYKIYEQLVYQSETFDRIGVYCKDDLQSYASILAVSLYGAAYVPLNSKYPFSRNSDILTQTQVKLILNADDTLKHNLAHDKLLLLPGIEIGELDFHFEQIGDLTIVNQPLAYILFTSGTSGTPKGVPVSKFNVNSFFSHYLNSNLYSFSINDKFLQVYELTFDVSVFSFFLPLNLGACCYIIPQKGIRYLEILKFIKKYEITILSMVPSIIKMMDRYLDETDFNSLRYSFFSGDKLSHKSVAKWAKKNSNAKVYNFYGPTETTIVCTSYPWNESDSNIESIYDIVPIGKPFEGMEFILVNDFNDIIDNNQKGELCFYGKQVIDGYLNNENLDKFIEKTINGVSKKYYKTGDIASLNDKGNLVFYGRKDSQVKINGYRVDLLEIESSIKRTTQSFFSINCLKDKMDINILVLFVENLNLNIIDFKSRISELLPSYMIPNKIILLDKIPLNLNNKVDYEKLEEIFKES